MNRFIFFTLAQSFTFYQPIGCKFDQGCWGQNVGKQILSKLDKKATILA
jgi:hypothetical protein